MQALAHISANNMPETVMAFAWVFKVGVLIVVFRVSKKTQFLFSFVLTHT